MMYETSGRERVRRGQTPRLASRFVVPKDQPAEFRQLLEKLQKKESGTPSDCHN